MVQGVWWRALIVLLALASMMAIAGGCGGSSDSSSSDDETTIALLLPNDHAAHHEGRNGFERRVKALCRGCKVLFGNAQDSTAKQQSQAERVLAEGADVLLLDPVDPAAASPIVQQARSAGVPVVSYARLIEDSPVDYYVGLDDEAVGQTQVQFLMLKLKEERDTKGPVVVLALGSGRPQNVGVRTALKSEGVKVAKEYDLGESTPEAATFSRAKRAMRRAIDTLGANGFVAVLAPDDTTAAGSIAAMREAGIEPSAKPTTGAGSSLPAVQRVIASQQYISVYEAAGQVGAEAGTVAVKLAKGQKVPASLITDELKNSRGRVPAVLLQPTGVSWENLNSTVLFYGVIDPKRLCVGRYVKDCAKANVTTG
jgi:D-xylose transport system substrate-binding protein